MNRRNDLAQVLSMSQVCTGISYARSVILGLIMIYFGEYISVEAVLGDIQSA